MDAYILFSAWLSFGLFLLIIAFLFRMTRREEAITWMIRVFIGIGVATIGVSARSWGLTQYLWWASLYGLLTILFVFGIFAVMEASLTLRLLTEIAQSGRVDVNRDRIVQRRIERFLYSGEIIKNNGTFTPGKTSYFSIREVVLTAFRRLFP